MTNDDIFHGIEIEGTLEPRLAAAWRRLREGNPNVGVSVAWSPDPEALAGVPQPAADLFLLFQTVGRLRTQLNACCAERDGARLHEAVVRGR